MSLYIGNLSEHTRRDELERVFRRFGPCNVQFKREGYGFVVFDYPPDATKALRAFKGRNICGEPLTLTWSNKQPSGSFQRFARGDGRNYKLQQALNSERLGHVRRKEGSDGWKDHKMDDNGRAEFVDVPGKEMADRQDDFKDYDAEGKEYGGEFHDDGGGDVPSLKEDGRWGEPIQDPAVEGEKEKAVEFDRYEPYGYDMKHDEDNHHLGYSGHSPAANSQENMGRAPIGEEISNRPKNKKFQPTCYRCGDPGHKMRDCPKENSSRKKFNRLNVVRDNKVDISHRVEYEDKFRSDSWLKLRSSGNALSMRHQKDERRVAASPQYHAPLRNKAPHIAKETDRHQRREFGEKKRNRNGMESPKRSRVKRSRQSMSSSLHSDYSTSHSLPNSKSPKSLWRSRFHSRSRSSEARSSSSKSRSSSKSQNCKGKCLNSRRSSSPTSLFVPVSLNQPLPSSQQQIQSNSKTPSINATTLENADHLVAQQQQINSAMESESLQSENAHIAVNGNSAVCTTKVDAMEKDQCVHVDNNENHLHLNPSDGVANLTKPNVTGNLSPEAVKEKGNSDHTETMMMSGMQTEIQKQASESHVNPHSFHSTAISTEEMYMVLKNYGLELPKDDEKSLTVESFFGSARLWPWHIVYYRRLKKGPISAENYARRVAQNHEFGIVDRYIRSSSGWQEFNLENSY